MYTATYKRSGGSRTPALFGRDDDVMPDIRAVTMHSDETILPEKMRFPSSRATTKKTKWA